jgi:hypothetical protein
MPFVPTGTDSATDCAGALFDVAVIRMPAMPPWVSVTGPALVSEKSNAGATLLGLDCGAAVCGWTAPGDKIPLRDGAFRPTGPSAKAEVAARPSTSAAIGAMNLVLMELISPEKTIAIGCFSSAFAASILRP